MNTTTTAGETAKIKLPKTEKPSKATWRKMLDNGIVINKPIIIKPPRSYRDTLYGDERIGQSSVQGISSIEAEGSRKFNPITERWVYVFPSPSQREEIKKELQEEMKEEIENYKNEKKRYKEIEKNRKSIFKNQKMQNICKKLRIEPTEEKEFNGYGYKRVGLWITTQEYKKAEKELMKKEKNEKPKKKLTEEEKISKWASKLSKLTGITQEQAEEIANEKIEYAIDRLEATINAELSSWKIPAWRKKADRDYDRICEDWSKALDRIKNEEHAYAILSASKRHKESNYEDKLEEAKELVRLGELDREAVQDYARQGMSY